jgi:serine/threonine protein kinase
LELCDFGSLADIMRHRTKQPFVNSDVVYIAFSVLSALHCLHQHLILHRDVKPDNVLVTSDGAARLADFGIATALALPSDRRHSVIGTSHYLAPEIIMSAGYDVKVDIWSLGLSLIELLDGKHPYAGQDAFRVMYLISAAPPPTSANALAPLAQLIDHCLNKRADARPSAADLLAHTLFSDAHQLRGLDTRLFVPPASTSDDNCAANANGDALHMPTAWAAPSLPATPKASGFAATAPIDVVQKKPIKTSSVRSPKPRDKAAAAATESKSERVDSSSASSDTSTTVASSSSSLIWAAPSPSMPLSPSPVAREPKAAEPKGSRERRDRPRATAPSTSNGSSKKTSTLRDKANRSRPLADAQRISSVSAREASPPPPPPEPVDMPPALPDYSDDETDEADRLPPLKSAMLPSALRSAATAVPAPPPGVPPRARNQATTTPPHRGPPPRPPPTVGSPQSPPQMATALSSPTGPSDLLRPQSRRRFGTLASESLAPLHELDAAPIRFDPRQPTPMQSLSSSREVSRDVSPISSPLKVSAAAIDTQPLNEEEARIQLLMALARRGLPMPAPSEIYFALRQARGDPELASDIVERMQGRVDAAVPASGAGDPHVQLLSQLRASGLASLSSKRAPPPTGAAQHCAQCARSLAAVAPLIEDSGRFFCSAICAHAFAAGPPPMPPARSVAVVSPTAPTSSTTAAEAPAMSTSARHNGAMSPSFTSAPSSPGRVRPVPPPALHRGESLLAPSTKPVLSKRLSASALDDLSERDSSGRLDSNDNDDNFGDLPAPRYATVGFDMAAMMRGGSESARAAAAPTDIAVPPRRKPPQPPK